VVADDGGGLDLDALAERRGLPRERAREGADEWVFEDGTTTHAAVDDLAGRGVGLAAVRRELGDVGFAIAISKSDPNGTELTITAA
jgi:chemotaxis protein histidine kinase CheA